MFIPHAASTPAIVAKREGRSLVTSVSSYQWRPLRKFCCKDPVQQNLRRGRHWYELTLVTSDRPSLFATMAGVLAAWGMNIVKAAAFSNQAGVVVDTFYFTDRFRTLELNLPEWERFQTSIHDVLTGK